MKDQERTKKAESLMHSLVAEYFKNESNRRSLITVVGVKMSQDLRRADIYLSIFPETDRESGLSFATRRKNDLRTFIKEKWSLRTIPQLNIFLDKSLDVVEKLREIES